MSIAISLLSRQSQEGFSELELVRILSEKAVDLKNGVWTFSDDSKVHFEKGAGYLDCSVFGEDLIDERELEDCRSADDFPEPKMYVWMNPTESKPKEGLAEILRKALHPNS